HYAFHDPVAATCSLKPTAWSLSPMHLPRVIARRLSALFRREKLDAEMSEEIRAHLELQTVENLARGLPPNEARYAARRSFGGVEQIKEHCRDERVRGFVWLEQGAQAGRS